MPRTATPSGGRTGRRTGRAVAAKPAQAATPAAEPEKDAKAEAAEAAKKAEAAAAKAAKTEAKRAEAAKLREQQFAYVEEHYTDGDAKLAEVAKHLNITSGKTAFIDMQIRVERGEVPAIDGEDDETLLRNIAAERGKADERSSWGWLAARSGKPESFIKVGLEQLGLYTPKAENISSVRAANKPKAAPAAAEPQADESGSVPTTTGRRRGRRSGGNA